AEIQVGQYRIGGTLVHNLPDLFWFGIYYRIGVHLHVFEKRKVKIDAVERRRTEIDAGQVHIEQTSRLEIGKPAIGAGERVGIKSRALSKRGKEIRAAQIRALEICVPQISAAELRPSQ